MKARAAMIAFFASSILATGAMADTQWWHVVAPSEGGWTFSTGEKRCFAAPDGWCLGKRSFDSLNQCQDWIQKNIVPSAWNNSKCEQVSDDSPAVMARNKYLGLN